MGQEKQERAEEGGPERGPRPEASSDQPKGPGAPEDIPVPELAEAIREKDQFRKLAQRVQADFINYRNRTQEEIEEARRSAVLRFALRVLEVMDLFDAALSKAAVNGVDANWVEGVRGIQRSLMAALNSEGIERMKVTAGESFDPRRHEALLSAPTAEFPSGVVIKEIRPGYVKGGEVIRPAHVAVATPPPDDTRPGQHEASDRDPGRQSADA
jgi:molecular chaperone GrpE